MSYTSTEGRFLEKCPKSDKVRKQFTCYNQLAVLMFGQFSNREILRDLVLATQSHASKAYHLGFGKYASKSTLADANNDLHLVAWFIDSRHHF